MPISAKPSATPHALMSAASWLSALVDNVMSEYFTRECANIECKDELTTLAVATKFAAAINPGLVLYLQGDLGAGKTTFARGLIHALGYSGKVKSPTYTLVESYALEKYMLYHFDLYRFIDEDEWEAAGFREYFNIDTVCLIEWPEKAGHLLPTADIGIKIVHQGLGRVMTFAAHTNNGATCLEQFLAVSV